MDIEDLNVALEKIQDGIDNAIISIAASTSTHARDEYVEKLINYHTAESIIFESLEAIGRAEEEVEDGQDDTG